MASLATDSDVATAASKQAGRSVQLKPSGDVTSHGFTGGDRSAKAELAPYGAAYLLVSPRCTEMNSPPLPSDGVGHLNPIEGVHVCVVSFDPNGKDERIYATGLRNCQSMTIQPETGQLWCAVNERDELGDNTPFEYGTYVAGVTETD